MVLNFIIKTNILLKYIRFASTYLPLTLLCNEPLYHLHYSWHEKPHSYPMALRPFHNGVISYVPLAIRDSYSSYITNSHLFASLDWKVSFKFLDFPTIVMFACSLFWGRERWFFHHSSSGLRALFGYLELPMVSLSYCSVGSGWLRFSYWCHVSMPPHYEKILWLEHWPLLPPRCLALRRLRNVVVRLQPLRFGGYVHLNYGSSINISTWEILKHVLSSKNTTSGYLTKKIPYPS